VAAARKCIADAMAEAAGMAAAAHDAAARDIEAAQQLKAEAQRERDEAEAARRAAEGILKQNTLLGLYGANAQRADVPEQVAEVVERELDEARRDIRVERATEELSKLDGMIRDLHRDIAGTKASLAGL
jgi:hypothetical protein